MAVVGLSRDWQGRLFSGMDPTSFRMRHLLAVVVVAGITAAVLRHFFHVHVGFSREEIRTGALIAAAVGILLAIIIFRRKRRP
jgi:fluoride ion exporter CrcB/FEX